jgi:hypothetical protein
MIVCTLSASPRAAAFRSIAAFASPRLRSWAAAAAFAAAAARWQAFGAPFEQAQALLGQGRCVLAAGDAADAAATLTATREILARLKATPALEEVDALLVRASAAAPS